METYRRLEELKESIGRDFRDLEERCSDAENKVQCLEKANSAAKELSSQLQSENASLKRHLANLQKELAYKDEKLKRKTEDLSKMDCWWSRFRLASERRFKAMKDHGNFPPHIREEFVCRDIDEQMKDIPEDYFSVKDNESSKKHRNLTTVKCKKKVRYDKVSSTTSSREEKKRYSYKDHGQVYHEANKKKNNDEENVFSDPNESTKLYHNECPERGPDVEVLGSDELSVHQKILVPETEDVPCSPLQEDDNEPVADKGRIHPEVIVPDTEDPYVDEVYDYGLHCSIGAPSAASTPLGAANSPRFGYNNGDDSKEVSVGILDGVTAKSPSNDTVNLLTGAKSQLAHLPKSDSQFPVDLSYTQPQSPTIPSRTQSLNQDMNLTADCSVSLLPHGMRNEEVESRADYKIGQNTVKESDDTVFINKEANEKTDLKRERNVNNDPGKMSKQTTLDGKLSKIKASTDDQNNSGYKRKRRSSTEADDNMWPLESKHEEPSDTVFKVPVLPPPKTPEVILLEDFPSHMTRKKSCNTLLSNSGDITELNNGTMDQSADLFAYIDDCHSPDLRGEETEKDPPLGSSQKENFTSNKNCATKANFKYVEVVRKKDERAKLNGYKCRECQEYYQGLNLPEEELKKRLKHCSRHRARFSPPPSTPPGFWNLSFPDTQEYMDKGYLKTASEVPAPKRLRRTRRNRIAK